MLEDVRLWRALSDVSNGIYVDVGAFHPIEHSVTAGFYEIGWSGVNIEPLPAKFSAFAKDRPRDSNLNIGVGPTDGSLPFYTINPFGDVGSGQLSTFDHDVANTHRREGFQVTEGMVPVRTLNSVFSDIKSRDVHFLKVDVEGFEEPVLAGLDLTLYRPWILVVEATYPNTNTPTHHEWEHHITTHGGYIFVHFDGLNRYYVRPDKRSLAFALAAPLELVDDFVSREQINFRLPHCFDQLNDLVSFLKSGLVPDTQRSAAKSIAKEIISAAS